MTPRVRVGPGSKAFGHPIERGGSKERRHSPVLCRLQWRSFSWSRDGECCRIYPARSGPRLPSAKRRRPRESLSRAARCRGVASRLSRAFGSAPAFTRASTTAGFSLNLATPCRGVSSFLFRAFGSAPALSKACRGRRSCCFRREIALCSVVSSRLKLPRAFGSAPAFTKDVDDGGVLVEPGRPMQGGLRPIYPALSGPRPHRGIRVTRSSVAALKNFHVFQPAQLAAAVFLRRGLAFLTRATVSAAAFSRTAVMAAGVLVSRPPEMQGGCAVLVPRFRVGARFQQDGGDGRGVLVSEPGRIVQRSICRVWSRALGSAPAFSRAVMRRRGSRWPRPPGAGGSRACPCSRAFGSAPAFSRTAATAGFLLFKATRCRGVSPSSVARIRVGPGFQQGIRRRRGSCCPRLPNARGSRTFLYRALGSAPAIQQGGDGGGVLVQGRPGAGGLRRSLFRAFGSASAFSKATTATEIL